jgi:hypothetical protein
MLRTGAHLIHSGEFNAEICNAIQQSGSLLVGLSSLFGAGVYAYYPNCVPARYRGAPFVVFQVQPVHMIVEIAEVYIRGAWPAADSYFFILRGLIGSYIKVSILGFVDCPEFPIYPGNLYYTQ